MFYIERICLKCQITIVYTYLLNNNNSKIIYLVKLTFQ